MQVCQVVAQRDFRENTIFFRTPKSLSALPRINGKTNGKTTGEKMRIDKFLKVSRVIKRRTVAAEACSGGRIEINGKPAKPAKEVKPGDIVKVSFGSSSLTFEVLNTDEKQTKQSASEMYRVID